MVHLQIILLIILLVALTTCQNDIRRPPHILEPNSPNTYYHKSNSRIKLHCNATGQPSPTYKWMKDGNTIIQDANVQFDETSGTLKISDFSNSEEGTYRCIASNIFNNSDGRITASSFSPPIKLLQTRIEQFVTDEDTEVEVTKFQYAVLKCSNKGTIVGSDIVYGWYESDRSTKVKMDNGRLFIDQDGNLHFSYTRSTDTSTGFIYLCGISSKSDTSFPLGSSHTLLVHPNSHSTAIKPHLQYSNSGVKGLMFGTARLECMFSGYDPHSPHIPKTHWFDDSGQEIYGDGKKYSLSADKRVLIINNLQEEDEKNYFCQARNLAGHSSKMEVFLNVTSAPIFVHGGAPKEQTVVENTDVNFHCHARSASNEELPSTPIWYINGLKMGQHTDPTKYHLSHGNKKLSVRKVKKATDILCVQCEVTNSEGTTWGDACLNVILPIAIEKKPPEKQEIAYGDVIDLTVIATTDPSVSLRYRWEVNGSDKDLPFLSHDPVTMFNTSKLTQTQFKSVLGKYKRVIFHEYHNVTVETEVVQRTKSRTYSGIESDPGDAAENISVDMWIICFMAGITTFMSLHY